MHIFKSFFPASCASCGKMPYAICSSCKKYLTPDITIENLSIPLIYLKDDRSIYLNMIKNIKDSYSMSYVPYLRVQSQRLISYARNLGLIPKDAVFLGIPSSANSIKKRGFYLISEIYKKSIPICGGGLIVSKITRDQRGLNTAKRKANMQNAYIASPSLKGKNVVIIDDIITTGASVTSAYKALCDAGAKPCLAIAIARTNLIKNKICLI